MAETAKTFGCAQGDPPQGAPSEGESKGLGGGAEKPDKPRKPKKAAEDEGK